MLDLRMAFKMDLGGLRLYRERVVAREGLLEVGLPK
jgi:hypothetical protein